MMMVDRKIFELVQWLCIGIRILDRLFRLDCKINTLILEFKMHIYPPEREKFRKFNKNLVSHKSTHK